MNEGGCCMDNEVLMECVSKVRKQSGCYIVTIPKQIVDMLGIDYNDTIIYGIKKVQKKKVKG